MNNFYLMSNGVKRFYATLLSSISFLLFFLLQMSSAQAQIDIELVGTPPSCGNFTDGKINVTVSGGIQPYEIFWSTGSTDLSLFGVGYGTYSVSITDSEGTTVETSTTLSGPEPVVPEIIFLDSPCDGPNVSYQVQGTGGVGPYTYLWEDGSTDSIRTTLEVGVYCVTVADQNGCEGADCLVVPQPFSINVIAIPPLCPAGCDGAAVVEIFGGQTPYDILWSNGATTSVNANLLPGTYSVTVTDANGCQLSDSVNIPDGEGELAITDIETVNPTCNEGGRITISAVASNGPITYLWEDGSMESTLDNIGAGTYGVTLTDINGCNISEQIALIDENDLSVTVNIDFECGDDKGTATAVASGGVPPYDYEWNNGQAGPVATELTPGELYKVSVTDSTGCTVGKTVIIADVNNYDVEIEGEGPACNGFSNGFVNAVVSGVDTLVGLTYLWNTGQVGESLTNLRAGTYSVTVADENGCGGTATITYEDPQPLVVQSEIVSIACGETGTGTATAVVFGGTPPYTYEWTNGGNEATVTGLGIGFHSVLITDANGCENFTVIEVQEINDIEIELVRENATCGENNGAASININGGNPPFAIEWNTLDTTSNIDELPPGSYSVTVTDAAGCSAIARTDITQNADLLAEITFQEILCHGGSTNALVTSSGGLAPYTYVWNTGDTTAELSNLTPGAYEVSVTDQNNCVTIASVDIPEPPMLISEITKQDIGCEGELGAASVMGFGGAGSFTYLWNTGETTASIEGLQPGAYTVTVTDQNNCTVSESVEIIGTDDLVSVSIIVLQKPSAGNNDGALAAQPKGGTPPYDFFWNNGETTDTIRNLTPGQYEVTVMDSNGCEANDVVGLAAEDICINVDDPGEIGYDQSLCGPGAEAEKIVSLAPATGGNGPIEYLWMRAVEPESLDPTTWDPIPNSNAPDYHPGKVYETTYFARCARVENCPTFLESNIVLIEIGSDAIAEIIAPPLPICVGDTVTFSALDNGEGATYEWDFGPAAKPATSNEMTQSVSYPSYGARQVTLKVTKNGCVSEDKIYITATDAEMYCSQGLVIEASPETNQRVAITWRLERNLGRPTFYIQRSPSPDDTFEAIGEVLQPVDSTAQTYFYNYEDDGPMNGHMYYRAKFHDQFGNEIMSNIAKATIYDPELGNIYAYPNPFKDQFTLERVNLFDNEAIEIDIRSATGQHMLLDGMDIQQFEKTYNMGYWPSGVYFITIKKPGQDGFLRTFRLTKVNQ